MTTKPDLLAVAKLPPFLMEPLQAAFNVHTALDSAPRERVRIGPTQADDGERCAPGGRRDRGDPCGERASGRPHLRA